MRALELAMPATATRLLLTMAACVTAVTAVAAPPALPAIMEPASQEHHPGKDLFQQLVTPDLEAAKAFYGGLFGWQFTDVAGTRPPYAVATLDGHVVAGVAERPVPQGQQRQSAWLGFFSVTDVAASVTAASDRGGRVLAALRSVPGLGTEAVLADPQGAVFGVLASASGDPPDSLKPVGTWIWRSLLTTDAVSDVAFYQAMFGYKTYTLPAPAGEQHILLASEDYARATANTLPTNRPGMHPHWLNFVRVVDAGQAATKATSLGGHVLVAPHTDRHGGQIAVVADPQGAPVGLFEWGSGETKELTK